MKEKKVYHIIGGGISGMSCAYYLRKKHKNADIHIYESSAKLGGKCKCFHDPNLNIKLDNGTHLILKSNKNAINLIKKVGGFKKLKENTLSKYSFYELKEKKFWQSRLNIFSLFNKNLKLSKFIPPLCQSLMNTEISDVNRYMFNETIKAIFPLSFSGLKSYISYNQLDEIITNPLIKKLKEMNIKIHLNTRIKNINQFNEEDKIIFATPHEQVNKILNKNIYDFNYSEIININYLTSVPITLPKKTAHLGFVNAITHWLFVKDNILSVTISSANKHRNLKNDEIARIVWDEICQARNRQASFLPPYKVLRSRKATITNDYKKKIKLSNKIKIEDRDFYVIGDWTSNEYPSAIDTCVLMAKKLAKKI